MRGVRAQGEPVEFLSYRFGRNYRRDTGRAYIGNRPSQASVQSLCRKVSELTAARHGLLDSDIVVSRINQLLTGWANYFVLGQVSPAYHAIDRHTTRRLRQWLSRKHKLQAGKKSSHCAARRAPAVRPKSGIIIPYFSAIGNRAHKGVNYTCG